jgi:putative resolvase
MQLITIKAASELLGVTTTTLRNWDKSGKFCPVRTLGGHRRYNVSDLEKILYGKNSRNICD